MRDTAIIYRSFYESIKELPLEDQARVWAAICEMSFNFNEVKLDGINGAIFGLIKPIIEANNIRYTNGSKPKFKQNTSKVKAKRKRNGSEVEGNKDKDKDKDNIDKDINTARKSPPSIQEVVQYFQKNGYKEEVARKAFSYYAENDWKDSQGKKVKNWKQKMVGVWFKDENRDFSKQDLFSDKKKYVSAMAPNNPIMLTDAEYQKHPNKDGLRLVV